eukprot:TCONS_00066021-protein
MAQNEELRNTIKQILVEEQKKEGSSISKLKQRLERKRTYDQTTFSKRGHEEQFKHTVEVIESLDDAIEALETGENESALTFIKQEYWEFLQSNETCIAGKISKFSKFWEDELKTPFPLMDTVKNGYKLPFECTPPPFYAKNNASSLKNKDFVETSINELLIEGRIKQVKEVPFCVNPLTVVEKNSKLRLVLDLRHINSYIQPPKFKYEDLKTAAEILDQNDFMITFDLTSGYHHVPINNNFQKFLGFAWDYNGETKYFIFRVLPFGLNIACWIFTKLMRQLVKRWRRQGIKCAMYLDDGILGCSSFSKMTENRIVILRDLWSAGLTLNLKKSSLKPERQKIWLGFIVDTENMIFEVPEEKGGSFRYYFNLKI